MDREHGGLKWLAWHIEALSRQKRLPSFNEIMGVAPKAMEVDEISDMLDIWMSRHNSRLSPDDRHFEVVEA